LGLCGYQLPKVGNLSVLSLISLTVTFSRACFAGGHPALASLDLYNEQEQFKDTLGQLPESIKLQLQLTDLINRANKTFLELGLLSMTKQQERTLDSLLRMFNNQLDGIRIEEPSGKQLVYSITRLLTFSLVWDLFYIAASRQDLAAMQFFKSETFDAQCCGLIFEASIAVLDLVSQLERKYNLSQICPRLHFMAVLVAMASLLRILKGSYATYVDQSRGSSLYMSAIQFFKSASLESGDLASRGAMFAEQIWESNKIFKEPDGRVNISLRVRNRLSGSVVYDAIRWWKNEFMNDEFSEARPLIGTSSSPGSYSR
jgi:transcriptional regulatory protein LEU3